MRARQRASPWPGARTRVRSSTLREMPGAHYPSVTKALRVSIHPRVCGCTYESMTALSPDRDCPFAEGWVACGVQRLFSMFPTGVAGAGLMLLRLSVATALLTDGTMHWALVRSPWALA